MEVYRYTHSNNIDLYTYIHIVYIHIIYRCTREVSACCFAAHLSPLLQVVHGLRFQGFGFPDLLKPF